jgi:hypothetical protein
LHKGRYPRRLAEITLTWKARNPRTFHEKILYKMAHDRDPALTLYADKVQVRELVRDRVGASVLPDLIGVFETPEQMAREGLPANFVLKPNHGSSAVVVCWEGNDRRAAIGEVPAGNSWDSFLVHPRNLDREALVRLAGKWLRQDHSYIMGPTLPEWAYHNIRPVLLAEEVLLDPGGHLPQDYKFFMFHGECRMIQVDSSRFDGHRRDLFDPQWNAFPARYVYPPSEDPPPRPDSLNEMLRIARALSKDTDFIRVDLYVTAKGIKFGELTNYPAGGMRRFEPRSFDLWLGAGWVPTYR